MAIDQWGRIKSPKPDPNTCVLVICDNYMEVIWWRLLVNGGVMIGYLKSK